MAYTQRVMQPITIKISVLCLLSTACASVCAQFYDVDTWRFCPADRGLPLRPLYSASPEPGSTEIRADATRIVKDGITEFTGDVEIIRDERSLRGDRISYDDENELIEIHGAATFWDPGLLWRGESAMFALDSDLATLESGQYWLRKGRGRGFAGLIETDRAENISVLRDVDYTTCTVAAPAWRFAASRIRLDHDAGRGSATHAVLKVRDVPVFYVPYINFPLNDKRKSGFLIPTIGSSNNSGFDLQIPYYFNIAPQHDATFKPRWLSDRGVMLGGEYRYLGEQFKGELGVEVLPNDKLADNATRSAVSFRHEQYFDRRRGRFEARIQNVSDAHYFEDFGRSLSVTSQRFLDRRLDLHYWRHQRYYLYGIIQSYQQVDDSGRGGRGPYKRLPQLQLSTLLPGGHLRLWPRLFMQTTYFDRDESVSGGRIDFSPSIAYPYLKRYARVIPSIGVRHTEYFLHDRGAFNARESRTVPVMSFDSQLFAERRLTLFGAPVLQTLEPRAFYLYIPKDGQDDIPIFDTGLFDISFRNLFLENRFSGRDRVGDANQLTLAATTRFLSLDSGRELFRASFGQIYYFEDREITLPGRPKENEDVSEFVAEMAANLGNGWSARTTIQYDPNNSTMEKASYSLRYRPLGTGIVANASYRKRRAHTNIEQTDLSFRVPVTSTLSVLGRWNYSLETNQTLELVGGLEFESCCWGARFVGRRFIRNTQGDFDTGFFVQVEFKGLAGYGRSTTSFLRKSIPGYESYF